MEIEFEAKFLNIDKDDVRLRLKKVGAKLVKPEFLQKRAVFFFPKGHEIKDGWIRIRDEGDRITMSLKITTNGNIKNQTEIMLVVDSFQKAKELLEKIGCVQKAWQETKREVWHFDEVEVTIDEWPFLEPYVEIEGKSEEEVKTASTKLGFNFTDAVFGAADQVISKKYGISEDVINNKISEIIFDKENPYLKWQNK